MIRNTQSMCHVIANITDFLGQVSFNGNVFYSQNLLDFYDIPQVHGNPMREFTTSNLYSILRTST